MPSRPVKRFSPSAPASASRRGTPGDEDFNVVAVVNGADDALQWLRNGVADLLLVACAGYSDRALLLLDAVARQNPDLNVMVLGHGSPNGFLRRAFEAGADDIVMLPATPDQISFEVHKMRRESFGAHAGGNENPAWSASSAPGEAPASLTSTNLAVTLLRGERVALHRPRSPVRRRGVVPRSARKTVYDPLTDSTSTSFRRSSPSTRPAFADRAGAPIQAAVGAGSCARSTRSA
jgi:CheY-like chemotaxis protein